MMDITDIASLVFACTAANHLGLIQAVQSVTRLRTLPVISCPKCLTFWSVLAYLIGSGTGVITSLAVSFLSAWSAVWLDLLMGFIDQLYLNIYEQIYPTADTADADTADTPDPVPDVPGKKERKRK